MALDYLRAGAPFLQINGKPFGGLALLQLVPDWQQTKLPHPGTLRSDLPHQHVHRHVAPSERPARHIGAMV